MSLYYQVHLGNKQTEVDMHGKKASPSSCWSQVWGCLFALCWVPHWFCYSTVAPSSMATQAVIAPGEELLQLCAWTALVWLCAGAGERIFKSY